MKIPAIFYVAAAVITTATPAQAVTDIIYKGGDRLAGWNIGYSIETDGKLGALAVGDIISSNITFTGSASSNPADTTITGANTFYFSNTNADGTSPVTATATDLLFNFSGGGGMNFCADSYNACYAYVPEFATDADSVVYHGDVLLPIKEVDNLALGDQLQPGTYRSVSATNNVFAAAVPEPAA